MKKGEKLSFTEYCSKNYSELLEYLSAFDEKEVKSFWDSEMDYIKRMYNRYMKADGYLDDGLAYFLSVMF